MQHYRIYVRLKNGGQATGRELHSGLPPDHSTVLEVRLFSGAPSKPGSVPSLRRELSEGKVVGPGLLPRFMRMKSKSSGAADRGQRGEAAEAIEKAVS
jgi:hypothetical protein